MNSRLPGMALCSLGALAACTPAPTALPTAQEPTPTPSTAPSAPMSTAPTPAPSVAPTPLKSAFPHNTPWPEFSASAPGGANVILSGMVYDETGETVDGAIISVRSLDASVPYRGSATSQAGSWVINNVPEGANVEILATKESWTTRRRVGSFEKTRTGQRNVVNFGASGEVSSDDPAGGAYFLSDRPEIVETAPVHDARDVDSRSLTYAIKLSEPLDAKNQQRFSEAIRIFPGNREAAPGPLDAAGAPIGEASYRDLSRISDGNPSEAGSQTDYRIDPADGGTWAYALAEDVAFMRDARTRATVTWDAAGLAATLTFRAPLIAAENGSARYQFGLVAGNELNPQIRDGERNQLGTDRTNSPDRYPDPGFLIHNTIRRVDPSLPSDARRADVRWAATHRMVSAFDVARDEMPPKLLGVTYETIGKDSRIALRFSEPMAAYNGRTRGHSSPNLRFVDTEAPDTPGADVSEGAEADPLALFSFAVGEDIDDAASTDLSDGPAVRAYDATLTATRFGAELADRGRAFRFLRANLSQKRRAELVAGQDDGRITIEIDPDDPAHLYMYVFNRALIFDGALSALKVQVEGLQDPAGNRIRAADSTATGKM